MHSAAAASARLPKSARKPRREAVQKAARAACSPARSSGGKRGMVDPEGFRCVGDIPPSCHRQDEA